MSNFLYGSSDHLNIIISYTTNSLLNHFFLTHNHFFPLEICFIWWSSHSPITCNGGMCINQISELKQRGISYFQAAGQIIFRKRRRRKMRKNSEKFKTVPKFWTADFQSGKHQWRPLYHATPTHAKCCPTLPICNTIHGPPLSPGPFPFFCLR